MLLTNIKITPQISIMAFRNRKSQSTLGTLNQTSKYSPRRENHKEVTRCSSDKIREKMAEGL